MDELIIVDDASTDGTKQVMERFQEQYRSPATKYFHFENRKGAAACRNQGVTLAGSDWILFGEDDAYLAENYTEVLMKKTAGPAAIFSGRLVNLLPGEDPKHSIDRFQQSLSSQIPPFDFAKFGHNTEAKYQGDITLPLTHAMILTKKELLNRFPYDTHYSQGNGFREESDFQMNAFVNGYQNLVTNDTYTMHLHPKDVKQGGHRIPLKNRLYWNIVYTNYFYKKYFHQFRKPLKIRYNRQVALLRYVMSLLAEVLRALRCN